MPYSIYYGKKNMQLKRAGRGNILPFLFLLLSGLLRLYVPELDEIMRQYLFPVEAVEAFSSILEWDTACMDLFRAS